MKQIKKILIANRGEIAIRVMRTARELGIQTVAVYSDADAKALHVRFADEAVHIGKSPASESYLVMDKLIAACKETHADAIHPGYGFLSENATFARKVKEAGLIFIGPSPESITVMGDKLTSKNTVRKFNVPLVPGMEEPISDVNKAKAVAAAIGYPIMIKASAGGGGKGMRIVTNEDEFESQMARAVSEAKNSFSDDAVFIEKFITSPKHIEVQVLGDQHGNVVYLFERECSIQRRNQKVIEEAPSPLLSNEQRKKIGEAAVNVAKSCGYYGAGTVEFIADENLDFYFLEMNTRLQVEHPVTEQITGLDLVKEQIRIAEGHPLPFKQEDLKIKGHSLEVRVYAEDPENQFLPFTGRLETYVRPQGPGVRVDDGYEQGMDIPIFYDPMIAKLITYGEDRETAIRRMIRAIDEYQISGIKTTLSFCKFAIQHPVFQDGTFTTKFVEQYFKPDQLAVPLTQDEKEAAAYFIHHYLKKTGKKPPTLQSAHTAGISNWKKNRL